MRFAALGNKLFTSLLASIVSLALAICRSIVEAHGGRIWAASNVNQGANFEFSLPGVGY
jgi:two-component system sensor kinase FixL